MMLSDKQERVQLHKTAVTAISELKPQKTVKKWRKLEEKLNQIDKKKKKE